MARSGERRSDRIRRWCAPVRNRWLIAAVVVGGVVRLVWAIVATTAPIGTADAAEYERLAVAFSHGDMPTFFTGIHSAYWAAGYPMILAPFVWVARTTGWISPLFTASLVNVVAGTSTIASTAYLAARWIGPRARNWAAWLIALMPAQIYYTSTAHSETVLTALIVGGFAALTAVLRHHPAGRDRQRRLVLVGLLVGLAVLVKSSGVVLFAVPVLALRADTGRWRRNGALRATGAVLLGALVLLVPWTIRNGVQVGVWTPLGTQNATVLCMGNHDTATGGWHPVPESLEDCYHHSPWDDERLLGTEAYSVPPGWEFQGPDEPRWYREASSRGLHWAVTHPVDEVRLAWLKTAEAWGDEWDALPSATNFNRPDFAGGKGGPFDVGADVYLWALMLLSAAGLALVPACRRAIPVWGLVVLLTVMIWGGLAQPHYRHPAVPLLAVLAGGTLAAVAARGRGHEGPAVAPAEESGTGSSSDTTPTEDPTAATPG